ncbi:DUF1700 domain-containing protein [Paenibacillus motobuensis]|uniref:DUF1700 domain-containing protein n=1 Tax=Paenibacillus motobuensis TaxID=295324 RepID=A0ABP3IMW1_9BACL
MQHAEFMEQMEELLTSIPSIERNEILYDYEEHFEAGKLAGKSDAEIINKLGSPTLLARELLLDYSITTTKRTKIDQISHKDSKDVNNIDISAVISDVQIEITDSSQITAHLQGEVSSKLADYFTLKTDSHGDTLNIKVNTKKRIVITATTTLV